MARTQKVFPPDAGTLNAGNVPTAANSVASLGGNCGRGIRRFGDIRHLGDNVPKGQSQTLTPGTINFGVSANIFDGQEDVNGTGSPLTPNPRDGWSATAAFSTPGTYGGLNSSDEGDDNFSGKGGQP
jgi:hypothetical protein